MKCILFFAYYQNQMTSAISYVQLMTSVLPSSFGLTEKIIQRWVLGMNRYLRHRSETNEDGLYPSFNYDTMDFDRSVTSEVQGNVYSKRLEASKTREYSTPRTTFLEKRVETYSKLLKTYDYYISSDMKQSFDTIAALFVWATNDNYLIASAATVAETLYNDEDIHFNIDTNEYKPYENIDLLMDKSRQLITGENKLQVEEWNLVVKAIINLYDNITVSYDSLRYNTIAETIETIRSIPEGLKFYNSIEKLCWWVKPEDEINVKEMICRIWNYQNVPDGGPYAFNFEDLQWDTSQVLETPVIKSDDEDSVFNTDLMIQIISFYPSLMDNIITDPVVAMSILNFGGEFSPSDDVPDIKISKAVEMYKMLYEGGAKGYDMSTNKPVDPSTVSSDKYISGNIISYDSDQAWYYNRFICTTAAVLKGTQKIIVRSPVNVQTVTQGGTFKILSPIPEVQI
jgi:hypothetical protein